MIVYYYLFFDFFYFIENKLFYAMAGVLILRFGSLANSFTPVASTGIKLEGSNLAKIFFEPFPWSERKF